MKAKRTSKTYQVIRDGKPIRVTVPEDDRPNLFEVIREHLSPQAVAGIAAHLRAASTKEASVNREMMWFTEQLVSLLGASQYNRLIEEIGL